jgi:hypothetical protein
MDQQVKEHYTRLLQAIEAERRHEEEFFRVLGESKTLTEKTQKGFVWYPVHILRVYWTVGEFLEVTVERKQGGGMHKFTEGIAVRLFNSQPEAEDIRGSVAFVRGDKMRILIQGHHHQRLEAFQKGLTGVELIYDDRPYRVMEQAIKKLSQNQRPGYQALMTAIGAGQFHALSSFTIPENPEEGDSGELPSLSVLNASQQKAIDVCIQAPVVGIIHGPPGTGKTTTLIGLAEKILQSERRLLVCAPSNNAVDLLTERLLAAGIRTLRVGNISRIHENLLPHTLEETVRNHPEWVHIKKVRIEAADTERQAEQYKRQFGKEEWDLRKSLKKEARELQKWANELERRLMEKVVTEAQVITCTLVGASHPLLEDIGFQTVMIDEASQATEAECWNAMLKGGRVILAGDHKQLPPTVKSREAVSLGMELTLLDLLAERIPHSSILEVQYRMHKDILGFSNHRFYGGLLYSHADNADHLIRNDHQPLVFIDTAGCGFEEEWQSERQSYASPGEYFILREYFLLHRENFLGSKMGIVSPYAEQVRYIREQIAEETLWEGMDVEVNTIDGFQGQEKDIIAISLVRSNDKGEIGFLKDERRLNVALTRARKKVIILGDSATVGQHELYAGLLTWIEEYGLYDSAWNYMS